MVGANLIPFYFVLFIGIVGLSALVINVISSNVGLIQTWEPDEIKVYSSY